jgi:hypothetical protein
VKQNILAIILFLFLSSYSFAQWQPGSPLSNDSSSSFSPSICAAGQTLHVVWSGYIDHVEQIIYRSSVDGGENWLPDVQLTFNAYGSYRPAITVFGSTIHIVWAAGHSQSKIVYKRSTNYGISWEPEYSLTNNYPNTSLPSILVSGSVLHVLWNQNREVYYKRSSDLGISWDPDIRLTHDPGFSYAPSVSASGKNIHIVWSDNKDGNEEIYYINSTNSGIDWGNEIRLTNNPAYSQWPAVQSNSSEVFVVWHDHRDNNPELYFIASSDNGLTWGKEKRLTKNGSISWYPRMILSGSMLHVAWRDYRDGNFEIYYKRSSNKGSFWSTDIRLTNDPVWSDNPSIEVSEDAVHLVWDNSSRTEKKIYYKRNPKGNLTGLINTSPVIPESFQLMQNYPNPFNPVTTIIFMLKEYTYAEIFVYDILGRKINTLVNNRLEAGTYEVQFDGINLPSGVYFYRLTAGNFTDTRKMTLLR